MKKQPFYPLLLRREGDSDSKALSVLFNALIALLFVYLFVVLFFSPVLIKGSSMLPNIEDWDKVMISTFSTGYDYGDVLIVDTDLQNNRSDDYIIKRVVGKGGDSIGFVLAGDTVTLYRKESGSDTFLPVEESYIKEPMHATEVFRLFPVAESVEALSIEDCVLTLEKDELFLLGDNRNISQDSRIYGPFKRAAVVGKMLFIIQPDSFLDLLVGILYPTQYTSQH